MNLYKLLNDDYRSFQLKEAEKLRRSKKVSSTVLKESVKAGKKDNTLKESVNVNVNSDDTNVSINVEDSQITAEVTSTSEVVEPEVVDVVEEPVDVVEEPGDPVEPIEDVEELNETAEGVDDFWSKAEAGEVKSGDTFSNGVKLIDFNKGANYILVEKNGEFIAAWAPELNGEELVWGQGHYFDNEADAKEYFDAKAKDLEEADVVLKNPKKGDIVGQGYANAIDKAVKEVFNGKFKNIAIEDSFSDKGLAHVEYQPVAKIGTLPEDANKIYFGFGVDDTYPGAPTGGNDGVQYFFGFFAQSENADNGEPDFVKEFPSDTPMVKLENLFKDIFTHDPMYKEVTNALEELDSQMDYRNSNNILDSEGLKESEELQECEVRSFRITRISPVVGIYMIEADNSKNERSYIVGKNFDSKTKTLDEAELFTDKAKANNKFKEMLVNANKKGE